MGYHNNPMGDGLDRHITGNYGEDQFPDKKRRPFPKSTNVFTKKTREESQNHNEEKGE